MRLARWTRTDQAFLEALLWALPGLALLTVVLDGLRALRGEPLEVQGTLPDGLVPTSELVTGPLTGTVVVQEPTATQYGWDLVPSVLLLAVAVAVAWLLLGIARSLRTGDPFTSANAARLRVLGVGLIVGGTFVPVSQSIAFEGVVGPLVTDGPHAWTLELSLLPALSGLLVLFLAEVFARGTRLREDVEGLV